MKSPTIRHLADAPKTDWYVLEENFKVVMHDIVELEVPKGYVTDGCSVPVVLWGIFPPLGPYLVPGLVHDFMYEKKAVHGLNRKETDFIFLILLNLYSPNTPFRNWLRYLAVRKFGQKHWDNSRYVDITNYKFR